MKQSSIQRLITAVSLIIILINCGCKKQDEFLDAKPNQALSPISTLSDAQNLLNNEELFNRGSDPSLGEMSSDDLYEPDAVFNSFSTIERNCYIWAKQVYEVGVNVNDWRDPYKQIYYANCVLDALPKITVIASQQNQFNQIKGTALFCRSLAFYNLVQTFAMPYDSSTASSQLGIPLRLNSDLNIKSVRSSEKDCYNQILQDLQSALTLLPQTVLYPTKPTQTSVNALLARVYLVMGNYSKAFQYADACLNFFHTLQDFNHLDPNAFPTLTTYSVEDIYHTCFEGYGPLVSAYADTLLYNSYNDNDLRKYIYFYNVGGVYETNSQYDFNGNIYDGMATDEIYLIRAECYARMGNTASAMNDLNTLLVTRWKTGTFVNYTAIDADDALRQILQERRKELWVTGRRWEDLRRLSKDPRFAITLTHIVNGVTYTLPPNDPHYALPIPDNEISLSGIQQNPR